MGIEQIQKIHEFGEINVIISLLLCAMLVIALKAGWEKLLDVLGLETKASLQKKALEKKLSDMEQKIAECTVASFRSSLWRMHRDFMAQGYITPDGLKTFLEMGKLYEKAGGNDIYHEKLLPDIESLEVKYTKDNVL